MHEPRQGRLAVKPTLDYALHGGISEMHDRQIDSHAGANKEDLRLIVPSDKELERMYQWRISEPHREYYTCRPVVPLPSYEVWHGKMIARIEEPNRITKVLINMKSDEVIGDICGFDYNERNHSMEIGCYLPLKQRGKGYGGIMLGLLLEECFVNIEPRLNRIYATTSDNNGASKRLLEKYGFVLDGRNRESYWIGPMKYDQMVYSILRSEWGKR